MTLGDWMFALVVGTVCVCTVVCGIAWKVAYADGQEDGRLKERNKQNMRRVHMRESRLLRRQREEKDFETWLASLAEDDGKQLPGTEEMPVSGWLRAVPDNPGPDNRATPDIPAQPGAKAAALTDTGAFRADLVQRTDEFIALITTEKP